MRCKTAAIICVLMVLLATAADSVRPSLIFGRKNVNVLSNNNNNRTIRGKNVGRNVSNVNNLNGRNKGASPSSVTKTLPSSATLTLPVTTTSSPLTGQSKPIKSDQPNATLPPPPPPDYKDQPADDAGPVRSKDYIYDLMESLMITIHEKLRRSETLENTCKTMMDQMSKRLDTMEDKFDYHNNRIDVAVTKLRSIDTRLLQMGGNGGGGTIDSRLQNLNFKVDSLGSKLTELKDDFIRDKRGTVVGAGPLVPGVHHDGDLTAQGSERRDVVRDKAGRNVHVAFPETDEKVTKDLESVKNTLSNMDSKFQYWMQQVSTTANGIALTISDLHDAIMEPQPKISENSGNSSGESMTPKSTNETVLSRAQDILTSAKSKAAEIKFVHRDVHSVDEGFVKETKLDKLFRKMHPIIRAIEKMDEMWNVVLGTQRLVDNSLQKSDQLLTNSYRQVQSLSDVKTYLQLQTSKIMQNLGQVEDWLKEQGTAASNIDTKILTQGIKDILNKTNQLRELQLATETVQPSERSSVPEPHYNPDDEAYHRDTEYAHDRRLAQSVEPKNVTRNSSMSPPKRRIATMTSISQNNANKTNSGNGNESKTCPLTGPPGINCADLKSRGVTKNGVYYILIKGTTYWFMRVYCDMETDGGGWTVIQRRDEFGHPRENFIRDWNDYKNGFGDMSQEFWLGNENVFMLTNQDDYSLRIDMEDFDRHKRHAIYSKFKIYSEAENYKLEIGGYEGNAGDSLNDPWYGSNLNPFSTYDRDNDRSSLNCASMLRGGWWWRSCGRGLNGIYLTNPTDLAARQGIVWFRWRGWDYTLKRTQMSIRPRLFTQPAQPPSGGAATTR